MELVKVIRSLNECEKIVIEGYNSEDPYALTYYDKVGGHSNGESFKNFNSAVKELPNVVKEFGDDSEYVAVEPQGGESNEFAIGKATDHYVNGVVKKDYFNSPSNYAIWKKAAIQCMKTGKIVKGKYK
jgi:hypothetical protein